MSSTEILDWREDATDEKVIFNVNLKVTGNLYYTEKVLNNNIINTCFQDFNNLNENPSVPPRSKYAAKLLNAPTTANIHAIKIECTESKDIFNIKKSQAEDCYRLQIKNDIFLGKNNFDKKTSVVINGDDCYSTININNNVPLYYSSVEIKDVEIESESVVKTEIIIEEPKHAFINDPLEALRRNLIPHVCGREDSEFNFVDYKNFEDDLISSKSASSQYELVDVNSDYYTDNSNRSSIAEDDTQSRNKFYELLATSAVEEASSEYESHQYECIKIDNDPIYEDIDAPPPLPINPPPSDVVDDLQIDKEYTARSMFEGASKYDILSYLVDAKERGLPLDIYSTLSDEQVEKFEQLNEDSSSYFDPYPRHKSNEIERTDSGLGSESGKFSLDKYRAKKEEPLECCEDCDVPLETGDGDSGEPLLCRKCNKKRVERKEIIAEIIDTEEKYGRDLQIILEEFYKPMLIAGLLTCEQLAAIFLNVEELLENSLSLTERLKDAIDLAVEQGDRDLLTLNIGSIFLEASPMLHAFEKYCVRQSSASLLLVSLEKEKELLEIFLRVSQMENAVLRRMNLNSFLMVPVQRVTKYPLLLSRLYKATPVNHETRNSLQEARQKLELHLNHINSETKDVPSKLWRKIGSNLNRRTCCELDLIHIKLRKIAVDVLEWNHDEIKFALEGKLLFTQPTDNNWKKSRTIKLTAVNALLVTNGKPNKCLPKSEIAFDNLIFPRLSPIREAALLLVRDKNGRYSLLREPLYLDRCVIAADPAWQNYFEVNEIFGKEAFIFKAEDQDKTSVWYRQLQYYAQGMGVWRKRRNALANIMISGVGFRS